MYKKGGSSNKSTFMMTLLSQKRIGGKSNECLSPHTIPPKPDPKLIQVPDPSPRIFCGPMALLKTSARKSIARLKEQRFLSQTLISLVKKPF